MERLEKHLRRIDGRGYKAYKDIRGRYSFGAWQLRVDHVQGDPFAAPSRLAIRCPLEDTWISPELVSTPGRRVAVADEATRIFARQIQQGARHSRGSGGSGRMGIDRPAQQVLPRSSCIIDGESVEVRFTLGLPAAGRRVLGREAEALFFQVMPAVVRASLEGDHAGGARAVVETCEDAVWLRERLTEEGLVAFVAGDAVLPRRSGVDPGPMEDGALPFGPCPASLERSFELPHGGRVSGMGIPRGVTLIVGGGYHGKSTLLSALSMGIYNHRPGDGRERVVTEPGAVLVRAEDGRRVEGLDISPFIRELPGGRSTERFSTDDASGSTSQAANIMEAMEAGASTLLIDEDTSANNFMIRDHRMQTLVAREHEPIVPFIDRVRELYEDLGVSTVLVLGGSGDYFDVADTVIQMRDYHPVDVTEAAREICSADPARRTPEPPVRDLRPVDRIVLPESLDPRKGRRPEKVRAMETRSIVFGEQEIDISQVGQLVEASQARAISDVLLHLHRTLEPGGASLSRLVELAQAELERGDFDALSRYPMGDRAACRGLEIAAAINRLRSLRVRPAGSGEGRS